MMPRLPFAARFKKLWAALVLASMTALASAFSPGASAQAAPASQTQPNPNAEWEKAAGGHQQFDVVAIHPEKDRDAPSSVNVPYRPDDTYTDTGGTFRATNWPVGALIGFAYKKHDLGTKGLSGQPARLGPEPGNQLRDVYIASPQKSDPHQLATLNSRFCLQPADSREFAKDRA